LPYLRCLTVIRRTHAENAEFVIRSIKAIGLDPNSESRLMQRLLPIFRQAAVDQSRLGDLLAGAGS
jgi:hypothetical protein